MSEKVPQSNSPESLPSRYWVPRSNGQIDPATLTGNAKYEVQLQRRGAETFKETVKYVEVKLPDSFDESGKRIVNTKMVAEHLLSEGVQLKLAEKRDAMQTIAEQPAEELVEKNEFDNLYSNDYDESDYSVEAAANRSLDTESRRQEMLEYADVALSGAMRNDNDLPNVIESAFAQAGMRLPSEKTDLINAMRSDARVRVALQDYLREKAEYYRSELPEGVRMNRGKRPNYPGGVPQPSLDVASQYAVSMITGEWDQAREDGTSDVDAVGNVVVGQHRAAARMILMAPAMARRGQNE